MSCEITGKKGPVGFGKAVAKVDGEIAVDAEISFAISDAEQPEG